MTTLFGSRTAIMEMCPSRFHHCSNLYDGNVRRTLKVLSDRQRATAAETAATFFAPWRHTTFAERAVVAAKAAALRRGRPAPVRSASNMPLDGPKIAGCRRLLASLGIL